MTKNYDNENTVHTIKILEALEGAGFEPVSIKRIAERCDIHHLKVRRVLLTLEKLGWAKQNERKEWMPGAKVLRFSNRFSEVYIASKFK